LAGKKEIEIAKMENGKWKIGKLENEKTPVRISRTGVLKLSSYRFSDVAATF